MGKEEALCGPGRAHHANELHLCTPILLNAFPLQVTFPHLGLGTHATQMLSGPCDLRPRGEQQGYLLLTVVS